MHGSRRVHGRKILSLLAMLLVVACLALFSFVLAYPAEDILSSPTSSKALSLAISSLPLLAAIYYLKGFALFVEVGEKELIVGFPFGRERITGITDVRVEIPMTYKGLVHIAVRITHSNGSTVLNLFNDFKDGKAMVRDIEQSSGTKAGTFLMYRDGRAVKLVKPWQDS